MIGLHMTFYPFLGKLDFNPTTFLLSQKGLTVYYFASWVTTKVEFGLCGAFFGEVIA